MNRKKIEEDELLKPEYMIRLYASGAFPMADENTINWYMPEVRTIIPLDKYNYPRSLRKYIEKKDYNIKFDNDFLSVVKACADRKETWISPKLIDAYLKLEELGFIHTVEVWDKNKLIGGLYGISFKGAFFGESMFSRVSQASKIALISLIEHLNKKDFLILDVQYLTEHLKMFGAVEISFDEYKRLLYLSYSKDSIF